VINDPITGQGSNNAAKCAGICLEAILEQEDGSTRASAADVRPLLARVCAVGRSDECAAGAAAAARGEAVSGQEPRHGRTIVNGLTIPASSSRGGSTPPRRIG
jgi:hypothetical protein